MTLRAARQALGVSMIITGCLVVLVGGFALVGGLAAVDPEDGPAWFEGALLALGAGLAATGARLRPAGGAFAAPPGGW